MNRQRLLHTLVITAVVSVFATDISAQEWARKMFADHTHDFGMIASGTEAVYRFEFQNIYKEDVHVMSVTSSCGCTEASIEKRDLKTWEKSAIIARFNTRTFRDHKQATLTVRIDKPFPAEVQLIVRGNIRANMTFEPGNIEFGEILQNTPSRQVVRVVNRGNSQWQITDVKSTFPKDQIRVSLDEVFRGNGVVNYDMHVELRDNVPPGYVQGELLVVTNEGRNVRYPISFAGKVTAALQLSPEVLTLGPLEPGQAVDHKVLLKASKPFRVTGISSSDACLSVESGGEKASRLQVLRVKYVASDSPGKHECHARISTDLGQGVETLFKTIATVEEKRTGQNSQ